jgi:hypothetical protein
MKKAPVKVLIRLRPTSNFAHHNMHIDEETGYEILCDLDIYRFMCPRMCSKESSIINKINGVLNFKKYCRMLRKMLCLI